MEKLIFKGFKQVSYSQFETAKNAGELAGYLWLVRTPVLGEDETENDVANDEYDLYFGSKQYGHYRAGELDAIRTSIAALEGNVTSILAALEALTTLVEENKVQITSKVAQTAYDEKVAEYDAKVAEYDEKIAGLEKAVEVIPTLVGLTVVDELPETGEERVLYLKKGDDTEENNLYVEYLYVNGAWEKLGEQKVDFSAFYTKEEVDEFLAGKLDNVKVNGITAEVTEGVAEVKVDATNIELGVELTADGQKKYDATDKLSTVLQGIQNSITQASGGAYLGVTAGDGIAVGDIIGNQQSVSVKLSADNGNLLSFSEDKGLFAAMYYDGDDAE